MVSIHEVLCFIFEIQIALLQVPIIMSCFVNDCILIWVKIRLCIVRLDWLTTGVFPVMRCHVVVGFPQEKYDKGFIYVLCARKAYHLITSFQPINEIAIANVFSLTRKPNEFFPLPFFLI